MNLLKKIENRQARVGVIGAGYVGLPLAVEFAKAGFDTTCFDVDPDRIESINRGRSQIQDVPSADVLRLKRDGLLRATGDFEELAQIDAISICVPTPLRKTKDPDVSYVVAAVEEIALRFSPGKLVVLESTTYPGTTDEILQPVLESSGLVCGKDFHLAFSPERVDPGNQQYNTSNTPKIIGGVTPRCTQVACALYGAAVEKVIPVSSTRAAEMVKLLENTFRAVNIGLANETALMCDRLGIDVWEVIDAAATKPFGFMPFYPGPGLGGHCIPIDPHYLSWKLRSLNYTARFIELAGEVNSSMPRYVVERLADLLNARRKPLNGSRVLVLGTSYKRDVSDTRESPALDIIKLLAQRGTLVAYHDPFVKSLDLGEVELESVRLTPQELSSADLTLIVADHSRFNYNSIVRNSQLVLDTRNATRNVRRGRDKIVLL
ncbi:MAG: nucleotide sugar dehydrogenase [Candidatus Alcyoniella australis]|nr:nucleotide sugar dehydrogenase [Candidatus Alcyoniella australis]